MTQGQRQRGNSGRWIALPALAALTLLAPTAGAGALYDAILEWTGPSFRVLHDPGIDQLVDAPPPGSGTPFSGPQGIAAREHGAGQRDVVYVLDTGNSRVQAFEVNGTRSTAHNGAFTWRASGVTPAAAEFDGDQILLPEWKAIADRWIIPYSETVEIDGAAWRRVDDLTAFSAASRVYAITYDDATNAPEIRLPAGSLTQTTTFRLEYLLTDNQGAVADAFGIGDVDYGISEAADKVLVAIDPTSGGPDSWQTVRGIALAPQDAADTSDDLFLLDSADNSAGQNQELFYFTVSVAGGVTYREAYDDALTTPWGLAVARSGNSAAATVTLSGDNGPFDVAGGTIRDANQVTGHRYAVSVAGGNVTISDQTTGRVLVNASAFADLADPFLAIPGISLVKNGAAGTDITISTVRATPNRFVFVTDTGANRVKVISAHGATPTATNDWLPGDTHTSAHQPGGAGVGASASEDYYQSTPAPVPPNWSAWTTTFPLAEGTLSTVTFDPDGTPDAWSRVEDLSTAVPGDKVYEVDWQTGRVLFGDGTHGRIPPSSTEISFTYRTTPDVLRYGSVGTGNGQFTSPKGIAARWNAALGQYDVYVADTGNNRVQKFAFVPTNTALNLPARLDYVCSWTAVAATGRALLAPLAVAVAADAHSPARVWVGVADTGHDRIALYDDTAAAAGGGTTAPAYMDSLGASGAALGLFGELNGLAFLANGSDLDLYAADRTRNTATKFERAEVPSVALDLAGESLLPQCFPTSGSYRFRFTTTNPPFGGHLDLYYGATSTFSAAKLCLAANSVDATASSAVWRFASSPSGAASAGNYYLFVRMKDAEGTVVASAQTTSAQLLCLDAGMVPRIQGADARDGDRTLYLQNGIDRVMALQIAYPESVMAVGFSGAFDTSLVQITGITQGNGWDGTGAANQLFTPSWSNTAGTYSVNTSVVGSPWGLNGNGPFTLARVALRAKTTALKTTPVGSRWKNGTISIVKASSGITMRGGASPASWTTRSTSLRLGWLGDIATTATGVDSVAPHLMPKPDGKIDFADQMAFTVGWNGAQFVQDPIADLGPVTGSAPNLLANPDGRWDIEDILAFTTMYSWASSLGFSKELAVGGDDGPGRQAAKVGQAWARTLSHAGDPRNGGELVVDLLVENAVDLTGAAFALTYDADQLEPVTLESAGFLEGTDGSLFLHRESPGYLEAAVSRLDRGEPGVDGTGTAVRATFRIRRPDGAPLSLWYDLRSSRGEVIGQGTWGAGAFTGEAAPFTLFPAWPNPTRESTRLLFSLDGDRAVSLQIFDASGRRVRSLVEGMLAPGYHAVPFDLRDDTGAQLPSGVYFCRLGSNGRTATGRVVLAR
jgi:hypothetical protein